jgi:hypothetical protein
MSLGEEHQGVFVPIDQLLCKFIIMSKIYAGGIAQAEREPA